MKKNLILAFFTILICLLIIELSSIFLVDKLLAFKYNPAVHKELSKPQGFTREIIDFYEIHYKELHHLRGLNNHTISQPSDLIFKKIGNGKTSILIQGDSWAEQYYTRFSKKYLHEYANKMKSQIIEAGTSSYSPSLMTSQLNKIRNSFKLQPDYIIAVIDQTDIGDELCRYRELRKIRKGKIIVEPEPVESNGVFKYQLLIEKYNALYSDSFAIVKMLHYLKFRIKSKIYSSETKKVKCDSNDILNVLETGISFEDQQYMINVISDYINTVFSDEKLKKLIFVTHPHYKHLKNIYSMNVETIINQSINKSNFKNDIQIVSFSEDLKKASNLEIAGIYRSKDAYSHLNHQYFLDYVFPKVFETVSKNLKGYVN